MSLWIYEIYADIGITIDRRSPYFRVRRYLLEAFDCFGRFHYLGRLEFMDHTRSASYLAEFRNFQYLIKEIIRFIESFRFSNAILLILLGF